jgi:hypothetical protein
MGNTINNYNGHVRIEGGRILEINLTEAREDGDRPLTDIQKIIAVQNMLLQYNKDFEKHYPRS